MWCWLCLSGTSAMMVETRLVELTVRYGKYGILEEVWGGREGGGEHGSIDVMGEDSI